MRKENLLGLSNYLKYYNFGKVYELQNVDESYHEFTGILEYTINMFCPRKINYYNNTKTKKKIG